MLQPFDILINQTSRSLALVCQKNALLIQDPIYKTANTSSHHHHVHHGTNLIPNSNSNDPNSTKRCVVEFVDSEYLKSAKYINLSTICRMNCLGILGMVSINDYSFLIIITQATEVGSPRSKEKIYKIEEVEFICLNSTDFDTIFSQYKYSKVDYFDIHQAQKQQKKDEELDYNYPFHGLKKLLLKGNFYFSNSFDITNNSQNRDINKIGGGISGNNLNKRFLWNSFLIEELFQFRDHLATNQRKKFDDCRFLSLTIRGFVQTLNTTINLENKQVINNSIKIEKSTQDSLITLISKIGVDRSNKIFGPNGLDDEGNVGNYIETEVIFFNEHYCVSYTIVRGNVPIYYEIDNQQSSSLLKKIQINRPFDATQQSFKKHFDSLIKSFGEIHIVNEISSSISIEDIENNNSSSINKKLKGGIEFDMFKSYYDHYQRLIEIDSNYKDFLKLNNFNFSLSNLIKNQVTVSQILYAVEDSIFRFAALCYDNDNKKYLNKQSGVFRVCSFNIMDKCNELEKIISKQVLLYALKECYAFAINDGEYDTSFSKLNEDLWIKSSSLWRSNNTAINKILSKYNTELKQINKKGNIINNNFDLSSEHLLDTLKDSVDSTNNKDNTPSTPTTNRNNFFNSITDSSKKLFNLSNYKNLLNDLAKRNNIILVMLGREIIDYNGNIFQKIDLFDPINDYVNSELAKLSSTYISEKQITLFSGTFNVNAECYEGDLLNWLFPKSNYLQILKIKNLSNNSNSLDKIPIELMPDVFFIGLQEIVELTAGQMMTIDKTNKNFWERKLLHEINNKILNNSENDKYILLWSATLGGLLSLIYIKNSETQFIKKIEESMKKTGLGGMAANKGGIAVSIQYSDTRLCLVSSHLAAGMNNVEERHQNFKALNTGLRFSSNKTIRSHDIIVWLGDFNYRINGTNDEVRNLIKSKKFTELFEKDQLNQQMQSGDAFPYYQEFEINFPPTYKFNKNEDTYDLSEKMRVPAWCDRILSRNNNQLIQLTYGSANDIIFSDHRPVYGLFLVKVVIIDENKKSNLATEIYLKRKTKFGNIDSFILSNKINDMIKKSSTIDVIKDLQHPSSDKDRWWFSNGLLAKVELFSNIPSIKEFDDLNFENKKDYLKKNHFNNPNGEFEYKFGMIVNPNRPINPFEVNSQPDFIYPKEDV